MSAAQEERFTRKKHDARFPALAIDYCLSEEVGKLRDDVDYVVFYDKPFLKFERLLETYLAFAPRGFHSFGPRCRYGFAKSCFRSELLRDQLRRFDRRASTWATACYLPSIIRAMRLARSSRRPFERGRDTDHGRRRRMGHDFGSRRQRQPARN